MRRDERADIWRQLTTESDAPHLSKLAVQASPVFAPQTINLGRFTVLTGTHGVGKSYLMRVLDRMTRLSGISFPQGPPYLRVRDRDDITEPLQGEFEAEYRSGSELARWSLNLAELDHQDWATYPNFTPDDEPWTSYVDPSVALSDISYLNSNGLRNARFTEPETVGANEPERLRQILGKSYEHLSWQTSDLDDVTLPFFTARIGGRDYTSDMMSMGELWVLYVLWMLRTASASNVVLIDEPEAFLSPTGHSAFLHEIARKALASKAQVVMATHSTAMIAATPTACLRVITNSAAGAKVSEPSTTAAALRILGLEPGVRAIVFVEDEFAAKVVSRTLGALAADVAGAIDVVPAGGASPAIAAGRALRGSSRLEVCVVLDGDQRGASTDACVSVLYLPGDAPEVAIGAPTRADPSALAARIGRTLSAVDYALDANRFEDHHDWFSSAAAALEMSRDSLIDSVILVWLADATTSHEAAELVQGIRSALRL